EALGDGLDRIEVALARDREPGLDDVGSEAGKLLGDLELLADVQRDAGRLLAVPQRGVEDPYLVHLGLPISIRFPGVLATKNLPGPKARGGVREHRRALATREGAGSGYAVPSSWS